MSYPSCQSSRQMRRPSVLILLVLVAVLPAAEVLKIDPAQSTVTFHGSSTLHDFDGTAKLVAGAFDLAAGHGMIEADATSMNTASEGRDEKMHDEIMVTKTWSRIRFDLTRFEAATGDAVSVLGVAVGIGSAVIFLSTAFDEMSPQRMRLRSAMSS